MKQGVPWSVKGVGPDARDAAKEAARRAGMTLGEWLNTMIARKAVETHDPAAGDTLSKLIERLEPTRPAAPPAPADVEARIEAATAEGRRRVEAVEEKTAAALKSLMGWVERSDTLLRHDIGGVAAAQERMTSAVREALALVVARLDAVERRADSTGESALLREAFAALEARLDTLDAQARAGELPPRLADNLADLERRLTALAGRIDAERPPSAASPAALDAVLARLPDPQEAEARDARTASALDRIQQDIAELLARPAPEGVTSDDVLDGLAGLAAAVRDIDPGPRLDAVQAELAALGGRIDHAGDLRPDLDELRRDLVARLDRLAEPRPMPELESLRASLAAVVAAVRANAPDGRLDAIADELRALRAAVPAAAAPGAPGPDELVDIRQRLDDIAARLNDRDDETRVAQLIRSEMQERMTALQDILAKSAEPALRRDDVEQLVDTLAQRIEQGQRSEGEIARRALAALERNIVAAVGGPRGETASPEQSASLEQRLGELAQRIDALSESQDHSSLDGLRDRLDAVHAMVGDALRATPDLGRIEALVRELAQKVHGAPRVETAERPVPTAPGAMTVAEKIAAAAAAAQTARAIGADLPRRHGLGEDVRFEFGASRPLMARAPEAGPATPEFIAAARRAAQTAQDSKGDAPGAESEPASGETGGKGLRPTLLVGAGILALALGSLGYGYLGTLMRQGDTGAPVARNEITAPDSGSAGVVPDPETVGALGSDAQSTPAQPEAAPPPSVSDLQAALMSKGLLRAARAGNADAAYEVGVRLADGQGVPRDARSAFKWFEYAAELGLAPAQYRVGAALEKGVGVNADPTQAKAWYLRAAEKGHLRAMHNLGVLFADGAGAAPDYAAAAQWFRRAADLGLRDSQYNLAILTARGIGGPQNLAEAWTWFALAAAQGDDDAARKRDEVGARLDAATLARAKAALAEFKPRPVERAANDVTPPQGGWDDVAGGAAKPRS
ncbi:hypothetical protein NK718_15870 [Alsobacter sp. SYSU M60028]|uniref:Localization factor PodJL n=1 Tax=Alsobacter ponti TaxID=2962936 RepID=A0ABT1LET0_9HYPH|nr:hypothetical protein [Alsobacter ponti]MCP8940004.1 hypothetical protein [Alsobacter ponti]